MPQRAPTDDATLVELRELADEIAVYEAKLTACYRRRADLFVAARTREPRIVQAKLAEAAGISDAAVIRVLRQNGVQAK